MLGADGPDQKPRPLSERRLRSGHFGPNRGMVPRGMPGPALVDAPADSCLVRLDVARTPGRSAGAGPGQGPEPGGARAGARPVVPVRRAPDDLRREPHPVPAPVRGRDLLRSPARSLRAVLLRLLARRCRRPFSLVVRRGDPVSGECAGYALPACARSAWPTATSSRTLVCRSSKLAQIAVTECKCVLQTWCVTKTRASARSIRRSERRQPSHHPCDHAGRWWIGLSSAVSLHQIASTKSPLTANL